MPNRRSLKRMDAHECQEDPTNRETCLGICNNVLAHIAAIISPSPIAARSSNSHEHDNSLFIMPQNDLRGVDHMTLEVLEECSNKLHEVIACLHRGGITEGCDPSIKPRSIHPEHKARVPQRATDLVGSANLDDFAASEVDERISDTRGSAHVFEDVSVGDHGIQILRLGAGDIWTAKRVTLGERAVQLIGTFSDNSLRDCLERLRL